LKGDSQTNAGNVSRQDVGALVGRQ